MCEIYENGKKGVNFFYPELQIAWRFCKAFPQLTGYCNLKEAVDYYQEFAGIKDIPAIRKILEASYTQEALGYIDNFFDEYKLIKG